jgi:hypothetical protein
MLNLHRESVLVGRLTVLAVDLSDQIDKMDDAETKASVTQALSQVVLHLEIARNLDSLGGRLHMTSDEISALERNAVQIAELGESVLKTLQEPSTESNS